MAVKRVILVDEQVVATLFNLCQSKQPRIPQQQVIVSSSSRQLVATLLQAIA